MKEISNKKDQRKNWFDILSRQNQDFISRNKFFAYLYIGIYLYARTYTS